MTITAKSVLKDLTKIVDASGADTIAECTYREDGAPSCIVGHYVARKFPKEFDTFAERFKKLGVQHPTVREWFREHKLDDGAINVLYTAQAVQDEGNVDGVDFFEDEEGNEVYIPDDRTWGHALAEAAKVVAS